MNPKDMALLELLTWNDSRIAVMLGVPPFLVGLPSGGDR
jgi:phage portal protein BeeE